MEQEEVYGLADAIANKILSEGRDPLFSDLESLYSILENLNGLVIKDDVEGLINGINYALDFIHEMMSKTDWYKTV